MALPLRPHTARAATLRALAGMIEGVQRKDSGHRSAVVRTGLPEPLDQLSCSSVHEWFCPSENGSRSWTPPLLLLAHLAYGGQCEGEHDRRGLVVWIGRCVWPQPQVFLRGRCINPKEVLHRSIFIDPPSDRDRLWAIELCARSSAVSTVVADGTQIKFEHSRRLQLAAEAGDGLTLLARADREVTIPSAAATRWRVMPMVSPTSSARWMIELVRCKDVQRGCGTDAQAGVVLEHDLATNGFHVPAELADRSGPAASATLRRTG